MSTVAVFSNPIRKRRRRRRNPESRAERSRAARAGARHRRHHRHRHRNPESHRERVIAARLGALHRRRRRHRNPIAGSLGEMGTVIIPAAIGAGGALGLNILLGYLKFLPASLQSGYGRAGVQIAGALAVGALGPKVGLPRRTATAIAAGISVIALYDIASNLVASKFPNVNLGENFPMLPGSVMTGARAKQFQPAGGGFGEVFPQGTMVPVPQPSGSEAPGHTFG